MFARTLIYKEYLILISLHDSLFYSLTFQIHIHIHIFIWGCNLNCVKACS